VRERDRERKRKFRREIKRIKDKDKLRNIVSYRMCKRE